MCITNDKTLVPNYKGRFVQDLPIKFSPLVPGSWFTNAFASSQVLCNLEIVQNRPEAFEFGCITEQTLFQYTPDAWRMRIYWPSNSAQVMSPGSVVEEAQEPVWLEWTNRFANHWAKEWLKLELVPIAPGSLPHVLSLSDSDLLENASEKPRWVAAVAVNNQRTQSCCDIIIEWYCPIGDMPDIAATHKPGWSIDTGALLDMLPMGTVLLDGNGDIVRVNSWLKRHESVMHQTKLPQHWTKLLSPDWLSSAWLDMESYQRATYRTPWLHPGNSDSGLMNGPYTLSLTPAGSGAVLQLMPLLDEQREKHSGQWDKLTGLHTRESWLTAVNARLTANRQETFWVGVFGLDGFQSINDTLGHTAGDWLLSQVTTRLNTFYPDALFGRWAGDEFVVLAPGSLPEAPFDIVMEKSFSYEGHIFNARCSGGIIEISQDRTETASQWVQYAEWALREAKDRGGNQTIRAVNSINKDRKNLFFIEHGFPEAVQKRQFFLLYQPLVDLRTKRIVGAEALLRWKHPEIGLIQPVNFIPVAEQTGDIIPLTSWVMETACKEVKSWIGTKSDFFLSVNLSPSQFYDPGLVENIQSLLATLGFDARNLKLEITEGVVLADTEHNHSVLNRLRELGVGLSIDDFGTGYSSLSYLKDFPVQQLKIDRSFVQGVHREHNHTLTQNIITLAHNMGLLVVAEGVETQEQESILAAMGCDIVQGYRYGHPMEPAKLYDLLNEQKKRPLF